jgi:hypothetical protein
VGGRHYISIMPVIGGRGKGHLASGAELGSVRANSAGSSCAIEGVVRLTPLIALVDVRPLARVYATSGWRCRCRHHAAVRMHFPQ